jgi:hypothetical protein
MDSERFGLPGEALTLLATATILPHRTDGIYEVRQTEEDRYRQYCRALRSIARSGVVRSLVLVENSTSALTQDLFRYVASLRREDFHVEALHYPFLDESVVRGKGYGEGWLITQAVRESALLDREGAFVKVTGRYRIDNLYRLMPALALRMAGDRGYRFICQGLGFYADQVPIVSTILFACQCRLWLDRFADAYLHVDDKGGWAFEAEVARRLQSLLNEGLAIGEITMPLLMDVANTGTNRPILPRHVLWQLSLRSRMAHWLGRRADVRSLRDQDFQPPVRSSSPL